MARSLAVGKRVGKLAAGEVESGGYGFELVAMLLCSWVIGGAYLDSWAHNNIISTLETFFTPWHAVMYAGFGATAIYVMTAWGVGARKFGWRRALPAGWGLSVVGIGLFGLGGVGDMIWHTVFGIEPSVDAAFSASHLTLMVAMVMLVGGALRAAWKDGRALTGWRNALPVFISAELLLSVLTLITQIVQPFIRVWPGPEFFVAEQSLRNIVVTTGIAGVVIHVVIIVGLALLLVRRWGSALPFGFFSLLAGVNHLALATQRGGYLLAVGGLLAGLAGDLILWRMRRRGGSEGNVRLLAVVLPTVLYAWYVGVVLVAQGTWWSIHAITGIISSAGATGLLLSYLVFPPDRESSS